MTIFVQHSLRGKQLFLFVSIRLSCQDVFPNSDYPSACSRCVPPAGSGILGPSQGDCGATIHHSQTPSLPCAGLDHHQTTKPPNNEHILQVFFILNFARFDWSCSQGDCGLTKPSFCSGSSPSGHIHCMSYSQHFEIFLVNTEPPLTP